MEVPYEMVSIEIFRGNRLGLFLLDRLNRRVCLVYLVGGGNPTLTLRDSLRDLFSHRKSTMLFGGFFVYFDILPTPFYNMMLLRAGADVDNFDTKSLF